MLPCINLNILIEKPFAHRSTLSVLVGLALALSSFQTTGQTTPVKTTQDQTPVNGSVMKAMQWRNIGPFRGGRSVAVAGHPTERLVFYMGTTGGGVWKTENGGITWQNISDGFFKTGSVGAIALAKSNPNIIYVGMGNTHFVVIWPTAMACINRRMQAKHGPILV